MIEFARILNSNDLNVCNASVAGVDIDLRNSTVIIGD
jgi:hypothetical protein